LRRATGHFRDHGGRHQNERDGAERRPPNAGPPLLETRRQLGRRAKCSGCTPLCLLAIRTSRIRDVRLDLADDPPFRDRPCAQVAAQLA